MPPACMALFFACWALGGMPFLQQPLWSWALTFKPSPECNCLPASPIGSQVSVLGTPTLYWSLPLQGIFKYLVICPSVLFSLFSYLSLSLSLSLALPSFLSNPRVFFFPLLWMPSNFGPILKCRKTSHTDSSFYHVLFLFPCLYFSVFFIPLWDIASKLL